MHLSVKIQIEGEFTINESLSINIEKRIKSVAIIRENNKLYLIVSKEVIDYNDKMPILNAHYLKPTPKDFFQDLIDIVKYVEAIGAEFLHLHKVFGMNLRLYGLLMYQKNTYILYIVTKNHYQIILPRR